MKFPKADLIEMAWDDFDPEVYQVVLDESIDKSRWRENYEIVFKHDGKYYRSYYELGLTENCDHNLWEYEGDMVECEEVVPVEKVVTTITYKSV